MKKNYHSPEIEIIEISKEDIVTTSASVTFGGPDEEKDGLIDWGEFFK